MASGADVQTEIESRMWQLHRPIYPALVSATPEKMGLEALWNPSQTGRELHLYDNVKGTGYVLKQ